MKRFVMILFVVVLFMVFGFWSAAQNYKPEVEALEKSRVGPIRDCKKFKGQPEKFARCFGYK